MKKIFVKQYINDGKCYRMDATIGLSDECGNRCSHFSLTSNVYLVVNSGALRHESGGCNHDEILRVFPELKPFASLHLCDCHGAPMYAVANGSYIMRERSKEDAMEYLRITPVEYDKLLPFAGEKEAFKYALYSLGIVKRWQDEANEAIAQLGEMCGYPWSNPYSGDEERPNIEPLTDEEKAKAKDGQYTMEAIAKRAEERLRRDREKTREKMLSRLEKKIRETEEERKIMLYIYDSGLPIDNVIYYSHTKNCVFNWLESGNKITRKRFLDFLEKVDYAKLPEKVTFSIK